VPVNPTTAVHPTRTAGSASNGCGAKSIGPAATVRRGVLPVLLPDIYEKGNLTMRMIATWLFATLFCCGVARAADAFLVHSAGESDGGLSILVPASDNNANQGVVWNNKNKNGSAGYQPNQQNDATSSGVRSTSPNKQTAPRFVKATQRTSTADSNNVVWSPLSAQPWTIVLIVLGWLAVAIVPVMRIGRWMRSRRAGRPRGTPQSRASVPSMLTAGLLQTQLHNHKTIRKPENEERKKSRRAA
jgi:hypothetical protein